MRVCAEERQGQYGAETANVLSGYGILFSYCSLSFIGYVNVQGVH
jgi:hypothetical protein